MCRSLIAAPSFGSVEEKIKTDPTLRDIAEKMRDFDFAMLSTLTSSGGIASRPMSNNRQVEYDGDNCFFTLDDTRTVADIQTNPHVDQTFQGKSGALGMKPFFIAIEARGELIRDKSRLAEHWTKDLDAWFKDGIETPGLVLVKVVSERLNCGDGYEETELRPSSNERNEVAGIRSII